MSAPDLRARFRGALLGTAVGDALGAPFEGAPEVAPRDLARVERSGEPLRWTDDTHMTLATVESLVARGGFDGADLARRFVEAHAAEPWRGYGAGPPQVFAAIRAGAPWDEPARALFGGSGSFGNGGAMRAAPAGLLHHGRPDRAADLARRCAAVTHAHELGLEGAALQAAAVAWLAGAARRPDGLAARDLLEHLRASVRAGALHHALDTVAGLAGAAPEDAAARLGNGIAAVEAVPAALWSFLRSPEVFVGAVRCAIRMAGDTDTIAAMAGALSGAWLGGSAIPDAWLARLEAAGKITALADDLHALATGGSHGGPATRP